MKKEQVDLANKVVFITDSKTPTGVADVRLTEMALEAFRSQIEAAGPGQWLFPSDGNKTKHQTEFKKIWGKTLQRAGVPFFRLYDLRSTYATRLSAGGVADEWVTQMLRQTDAQVFKKYSQMKLQMKREALVKLNRKASETGPNSDRGARITGFVEPKMLIRKGEIGTPGKIRTYDLLLRRQEHLHYVVDATGAIGRLRGFKRACSALFDAPF